ncbi:MAG: hypothetical protein CMM07_19155 [Rhodopirellula sp.]|nr:hypothetical protein [Rhodopirellula sp.]
MPGYRGIGLPHAGFNRSQFLRSVHLSVLNIERFRPAPTSGTLNALFLNYPQGRELASARRTTHEARKVSHRLDSK